MQAAPHFKPLSHYENFPVASVLLPARLRPAVQVIYAFARSADDLADEGDATAAERLAALAAYKAELDAISQRRLGTPAAASDAALSSPLPRAPLFAALDEILERYDLPLQPLFDLLSAFSQDVVVARYADAAAVRDYCARSANPVGNLMLHLYGAADSGNLRDADAICTALQLINFIQDVAIDWRKQRLYLPLHDLRMHGIDEDDIALAVASGRYDQRWRDLLAHEVAYARELMLSGAPLANRLPGRLGWELRLVVQGGLRILRRVETADYDIFRRRPVLGWRDWLAIGWRALLM